MYVTTFAILLLINIIEDKSPDIFEFSVLILQITSEYYLIL